MTRRFISLSIWILFVVSTFNHFGLAQQSTLEKLEKRIIALEKRVAVLEQKAQQPDGQKIQSSEKWKNRSLWRRLETDMSTDDVESLLGVPRNISGGDVTYWYYSSESWHSYVTFYKGRVSGWKEPD